MEDGTFVLAPWPEVPVCVEWKKSSEHYTNFPRLLKKNIAACVRQYIERYIYNSFYYQHTCGSVEGRVDDLLKKYIDEEEVFTTNRDLYPFPNSTLVFKVTGTHGCYGARAFSSLVSSLATPFRMLLCPLTLHPSSDARALEAPVESDATRSPASRPGLPAAYM